MTDTPDKEWIERAIKYFDTLDSSYLIDGFPPTRSLAREFQSIAKSSFDQGVERERERCAAIAAAEARAQRFDSEKFVAERIEEEILTPTPTEGERGS